MNNAKAIFIKQLTGLIKVPSLIIQGILFLAIAAVFVFLATEDSECYTDTCVPAYVCEVCEEDRFELPLPSGVALFAVIFIGLALVGSASGQVYEDKTTNNLRFMAMADVKPFQYLLGTAAAMIIVVTVMLTFYAALGGYIVNNMLWFMTIGVSGGIVSILLGIVIGLSKMPILATPLSLILGLGPTIGSVNETIARALRFTFIQQVNIAMADLNEDLTSNFLIIGANGAVVLLLFIWMHRKNRFNL